MPRPSGDADVDPRAALEPTGLAEVDRGLVRVLVVDEVGEPRDDVVVDVLSGARTATRLAGPGMWLVEGASSTETFVWLDDQRGDRRTRRFTPADAVDGVVQLMLERQLYLDGRVVDASGRAVADDLFTVELLDGPGTTLTTDADGRFHLRWVEREQLRSIVPVGWVGLAPWRRFRRAEARVVSEEPLVYEVERCAFVELHPVVPTGTAIAGGEALRLAVADLPESGAGAERLLELPDGPRIPVGCGAENLVWARLGQGDLRSECLLAGTLRDRAGEILEVAMRPARSLAVRVVDPDGRPVVGCSIGFDRAPRDVLDVTARWDGSTLTAGRATGAEAVTDDQGRAEVTEGVGWMRVGHPAHGVVTLDARAWCDVSDVTVLMPRSRSLTGRVVFGEGVVAPSDPVHVMVAQGGADVSVPWWVPIEEDGRFRIPHVATGHATLRIGPSRDEVLLERRVLVPEEGLDLGELVIGVPPGEVALEIASDCVLHVSVQHLDGDGRPLRSVEFERDGALEWRGRVPETGVWAVRVLSEGSVQHEDIGSIDVGLQGGRFVLDGGVGRAAFVLTGDAPTGARLQLHRLDAPAATPRRMRSQGVPGPGVLQEACLPLGSYVASITAEVEDTGSRGVVDWEVFELREPGEATVDLALDGRRSVTVEVVGADGSPVPGAELSFVPGSIDGLRFVAGVTDASGEARVGVPRRGTGLWLVETSGVVRELAAPADGVSRGHVTLELP